MGAPPGNKNAAKRKNKLATVPEESSSPRKKNKAADEAYDVYDVPTDNEASARKRRRIQRKPNDDDEKTTTTASPRKARRKVTEEEEAEDQEEEQQQQQTPSKRRGGRPSKASTVDPVTTPSALRQKKVVAETPLRLKGINGVDTPSRRGNADRSARRKSARALIDRVMGDAVSDEEGEEQDIAREIFESSDEEEEVDEEQLEEQEEAIAATTPSKTPGRKRKQPGAAGPASTTKGRRRRSPTPPRDLPPHEQYFFQNKPGLAKTSNNNLSSLDLLTHDEYFSVLRERSKNRPHAADVEFLQSLHAESFPQWSFELAQGFGLCLYGYGSKRRLLHRFATYLSSHYAAAQGSSENRMVVINGYVRTLNIREILATVGTAIDPKHKLGSGTPTAIVQNLLSLLSTTPLQDVNVTLIINSLDAPPLRKTATQSVLAQLASHPRIRLACSVDTPDFPLLWDSGLRSSFNFVFHDCTTFAPFGPAEIDVVDEVHELLGRTARRAGGKEGVVFVLRSLPENAKNLFRLLVTEVLVAMDEDGGGGGADGPSVEYRMLYNKAVEEFICSSEMAFRTLLKE